MKYLKLILIALLIAGCSILNTDDSNKIIGTWELHSSYEEADWIGQHSFNVAFSQADTITINNPNKYNIWLSDDTLNTDLHGRFFFFMDDSAYAGFPEYDDIGVPRITITTQDTTETAPITYDGGTQRLRPWGLEIRYDFYYNGCEDEDRRTSDRVIVKYNDREGNLLRMYRFNTNGMLETLNEVAC